MQILHAKVKFLYFLYNYFNLMFLDTDLEDLELIKQNLIQESLNSSSRGCKLSLLFFYKLI